MDSVAPSAGSSTPSSPGADKSEPAGLQSLVFRSNASGQAERQAQAPPTATGGGAAAGAGGSAGGSGSGSGGSGSATAGDAVVSSGPRKGCLWCLCRCFFPKPAGVVSKEEPVDMGDALLPPLLDADRGKKCLVLDLDETLVHSSFRPIPKPDYIIPVEIDNVVHHVYVRKRPYCDVFLRLLAETYEIVVFTASLSKYADPLLDKLDTHRVIRTRLFRESCVYHMGNYVKDLTQLGRPIEECIIVDNSPASYFFQPENAIACESFIEDPADTELLEMIPYLQSILSVKDVRTVLGQWQSPGPGTVLGPDPVRPVRESRPEFFVDAPDAKH